MTTWKLGHKGHARLLHALLDLLRAICFHIQCRRTVDRFSRFASRKHGQQSVPFRRQAPIPRRCPHVSSTLETHRRQTRRTPTRLVRPAPRPRHIPRERRIGHSTPSMLDDAGLPRTAQSNHSDPQTHAISLRTTAAPTAPRRQLDAHLQCRPLSRSTNGQSVGIISVNRRNSICPWSRKDANRQIRECPAISICRFRPDWYAPQSRGRRSRVIAGWPTLVRQSLACVLSCRCPLPTRSAAG